MLTKSELREILTSELEGPLGDEAEEIADSIVERLDESGAFEIDEDGD